MIKSFIDRYDVFLYLIMTFYLYLQTNLNYSIKIATRNQSAFSKLGVIIPKTIQKTINQALNRYNLEYDSLRFKYWETLYFIIKCIKIATRNQSTFS